ncbi:MAG TPA: mechanosensitive ion channel domain-containing protein [Polyangiales bacterium]|nr:mechanosensitive ion channel domain-containing protein [Polyangiales bacterium]
MFNSQLISRRFLLALALGGVLLAPTLASAAPTKHQENGPLYEAAEEAFDGVLLELAPPALRKRGPGNLLWAQWIGMPIVLLLGFVIGYAFHRLSRAAVRPLARRTVTPWDDALIEALNGPLIVTWTLLSTFFLSPLLGLRPAAEQQAHHILRAAWLICLFWAFIRSVDVATRVLSNMTLGESAHRALVPVVAKMGKLVVVAFAAVALLSELGYSVTSLLAGLGIGGLAVALAAQKTFEHWLGAFSIAIDKPFREGDYVKVNGVEGTIEEIGMRSTRLRTPARTVISIPNGKLAEMQPENMAPRDRMRLFCEIRLRLNTSTDQVREILRELMRVLREHPKLWSDGQDTSVVLRELAVSALVIEVVAFFATTNANEFNAIRQDVLLDFMQVVEAAGAELALPEQRLELSSQPSAAASDIQGLTTTDKSRQA